MGAVQGPVAVREATTPDALAFAEFFVTAWREAGPDAPGFEGATEEAIAELTTPDAFEARIGGPTRRMFLAWEADRVVGFASTGRISDEAVELSGIIVLRCVAGQGIGTALVEAAMATSSRDGYSEMVVKTETTNSRAQVFYQDRGFDVVGVETEYVDDIPVEVLRLSRSI